MGRPGTSKTLAIQIIASNLLGKQSPHALWRNFPAVYIFQYQCSPLSTSASILFQYEAAKSYQQHSQDVITVLLLDEVGLAENSPDLPLKVLHYMLVEPEIAIVGLSNWALDSSKMNRAACLQRPEPSPEDIMQTGQNIVGSMDVSVESAPEPPVLKRETSGGTRLLPWVVMLSQTFHSIYSNQSAVFGPGSRDFIGMRDYYSLLKQLRMDMKNCTHPTQSLLANAIARNFGGNHDALKLMMNMYFQACFASSSISCESLIPKPYTLIRDNLESTVSRHLMVLSSNDSALHLLFGSGTLDDTKCTVLVGSRFKNDMQELHLIQEINQIKNAMAKGEIVVLLNNESIFESLYDVLNQRYVIRPDMETGQNKKMLRLALGPRSLLCPVEEGFKLVVIVNQRHAYEDLDLPLLNRFEKQLLTPADLLNDVASDLLLSLEKWCLDITAELGGKVSLYDVFCGFYEGTLSSLCLLLTQYGRSDSSLAELLPRARQLLMQCAFPAAVLRSELLREELLVNRTTFDVSTYLANTHLFQYIQQHLLCDGLSEDVLVTLTTKSPLSHFTTALATFSKSDARREHMHVLNLAMMASEKQFVATVEKYLLHSRCTSENEVLFVVSDPIECTAPLISHARYLLTKLYRQHRSSNGHIVGLKHVVFIIHLPTGVRERQRDHILDFHATWTYRYIDDLRMPADIPGSHVSVLVDQSVYDMFSGRPQALSETLIKVCTSVVCRMQPPAISSQLCEAYDIDVSPIKVILTLMRYSAFAEYIVQCVMSCLRQYSDASETHLHVQFACFDSALASGSFRESLIAAVDSIVWQSLLHALLQLDHDFNLRRLYTMHQAHDSDIWLQLAYKLMDDTAISRSCILVPPSCLRDVNCQIPNGGLHGTLVCQFPFSNRVISVVNSIRERVTSSFTANTSMNFANAVGAIDALLNLTCSPCLQAIDKCGAEAYVHDFVSAVVHPLPHVQFISHVAVLTAAIRCLCDGGNVLPSHIHAAYWTCESETFELLSMISYDCELRLRNKAVKVVSMEKFVLERLKDIRQSFVLCNPVATLFLEAALVYLSDWLDDLINQLQSGDEQYSENVRCWCELYAKCVAPIRSLIAGSASDNVDGILQQMEIWWKIGAAYTILIDVTLIHHVLADEESTSRNILCALLHCATTCSPITGRNCKEFVQICCDTASQCSGFTFCVLSRFVSAFLVEENAEYKKLIDQPILLSTDVLHVLTYVLNIADCAEHTGINATALLLLQRTVVSVMAIESSRNNTAEELLQSTFSFHSKHGTSIMLLYRNFVDDSTSSSNDEFDVALLSDMEQGNNLYEVLVQHGCRLVRNTVQVRQAIARYARLCATALTETVPLPTPTQQVSEMLCRSELTRVYFIKNLKEIAGEAGLLSYVKLANPPFMPQGSTPLNASDKPISQLPFNPFPLLQGNEAYVSACIALNAFCKGDASSTSALDNWLSHDPNTIGVSKEKRIALLLAAAFKVPWSSTQGHVAHAFAGWLKKKTGNNATSRQLIWIIDAKQEVENAASPVQAMLIQLKVHISLLCVEWPNSWLAALIVAPASLTNSYFPSLSSEFADLAMSSGYVSWYKCPNGHPYSVGACTYPMETARCPAEGCYALIGGRNHQAVKGVTRLGVGSEAAALFAQPGYTIGGDMESYKGNDSLEVHMLLLRYILHALMLLSAELCDFHTYSKNIAYLIDPNKSVSNLNSTRALLQHRVTTDYQTLKQRLNFSDEDVVMWVHMTLAQWSASLRCQTLPSMASRYAVEYTSF